MDEPLERAEIDTRRAQVDTNLRARFDSYRILPYTLQMTRISIATLLLVLPTVTLSMELCEYLVGYGSLLSITDFPCTALDRSALGLSCVHAWQLRRAAQRHGYGSLLH